MTAEGIIKERKELTSEVTPHKILTGSVAYYYIQGLQELEKSHLKVRGDNKVFRGATRFLMEYKEMMGGSVPDLNTLRQYKDMTMRLADIQEEAVLYGLGKKDFFKVYGEEFDLKFLAVGGYALLVKTYEESLLKNFVELCTDELRYGFKAGTYRDSLLNHFASEVLMDPASNSIINDLLKKFDKFDVSIELGAGSGSFSKKFLAAFPSSFAEITDINDAVHESAGKNLEGVKADDNTEILEGKHFNITTMDMRDEAKLKSLAEKWKGKKIFIHIGYILHEEKKLAEETLTVLAKVFKDADVTFGFSEHHLQTEIVDNTTLHFQGLHYSTQDLMTREEFIELVVSKGFKQLMELDKDNNPIEKQTIHNSRTNSEDKLVVINSTTYWHL